MTIYKTPAGEKKSDKDPEVLTEPLTGVKVGIECDEAVVVGPRLVRVTYFPKRHRTWVNLCLILTAVMVLGTGTIAAIFLHRHLSNKVVSWHCEVAYLNDAYSNQQEGKPSEVGALDMSALADQPVGRLEETIEVSVDEEYEKCTISEFEETEETIIWHDFGKNFTAIVDSKHRVCYIMPLNHSRISPPRDLIDLINKYKSGYYMPNATVVHEEYRIVQPQIRDLTIFGSYIMSDCYWFETFHLEKHASKGHRQHSDAAVLTKFHDQETYGFFNIRFEHSVVYKMNIIGIKETLKKYMGPIKISAPQ